MSVPARFRGGTLYDRYAHLRDRIFSNPRFQRWAAGSWLARWMARRRSTALFDLCAGFVYSQILTAASRLGLFKTLADGPLTTEQLAAQVELHPRRLETLLEACVGLRLLERRGEGRWGLGVLGSPLLGNPSVSSMLRHHALLYRDLEDPVGLLRAPDPDTELRRYWGYARSADPSSLSERDVGPYSSLMTETQTLLADDVLDALRGVGGRVWLDVGGGEGGFLRALLRHRPDMQARLLDLPSVVRRAAAGGGDVEATGGDMFTDPWPSADVVSLVRILHDHEDEAVEQLLNHAFEQMRPGAQLVVAEPMREGHPRVGAAYFGFYLLAMGQGRPRSVGEISDLVRKAGFTRVQALSTRRPLLAQLLRARRPEARRRRVK